MPEREPALDDLSTVRVRRPADVMLREFPEELVVLHLGTGRYHGLNRSAGGILEALFEAPTAAAAAEALAARYGRPAGEMEAVVRDFCRDLAARDLVEIDDVAAG